MPQQVPDYFKSVFNDGPFNPFVSLKSPDRGDEDDTAAYVREPDGDVFLRPWLGIEGGRAFMWPLGIEGFTLSIDPELGIHKYIGDNAVKVDVMHKGEEHIVLTGNFPGSTSVAAFRALRDLVYADTPPKGKLLYIPFLLTYTQRVTIARANFDRSQDDRGSDLTYSIEFVRTGLGPDAPDPSQGVPDDVVAQGSAPSPKSGTGKVVIVTAKYNTLRKIAAWKLGSSDKWRAIYDKNQAYFTKNNINAHQAPTHRLKPGVRLYY